MLVWPLQTFLYDKNTLRLRFVYMPRTQQEKKLGCWLQDPVPSKIIYQYHETAKTNTRKVGSPKFVAADPGYYEVYPRWPIQSLYREKVASKSLCLGGKNRGCRHITYMQSSNKEQKNILNKESINYQYKSSDFSTREEAI